MLSQAQWQGLVQRFSLSNPEVHHDVGVARCQMERPLVCRQCLAKLPGLEIGVAHIEQEVRGNTGLAQLLIRLGRLGVFAVLVQRVRLFERSLIGVKRSHGEQQAKRLAKSGENGSTDGARAQFSLWMICSRSARLARSSAVDWEAA